MIVDTPEFSWVQIVQQLSLRASFDLTWSPCNVHQLNQHLEDDNLTESRAPDVTTRIRGHFSGETDQRGKWIGREDEVGRKVYKGGGAYSTPNIRDRVQAGKN